jgi:hypothetical protein
MVEAGIAVGSCSAATAKRILLPVAFLFLDIGFFEVEVEVVVEAGT